MHSDVTSRLESAGLTLQMLPMQSDGLPAGDKAAWPDILQEFWDLVGKADKGTVEERLTIMGMQRNATKLGVTTSDVGQLDQVLRWLLKVDKLHRKVVFARMMLHPTSLRPRYTWKQIADSLGASEGSIRRWHAAGLQAILEHLAESGEKIV